MTVLKIASMAYDTKICDDDFSDVFYLFEVRTESGQN